MHRSRKVFYHLILLALFANPASAAWYQAGSYLNCSPTADGRNPHIAAWGETPYVAWHEFVSGLGWHAYVKTWNGTDWDLIGGVIGGSYPSLAVYEGVPYVAVCQLPDGGGYDEVRVKRFNGSDWEQVGSSLDMVPAWTAINPEIAFSDLGVAYVAWEEAQTIYAARYNGSDWEMLGGTLNEDPAKAGSMQSITVAQETPYVAWREYQGPGTFASRFFIYVKRFNGLDWEFAGSGELNLEDDTCVTSVSLARHLDQVYLSWIEYRTNTNLFKMTAHRWEDPAWVQLGGVINVIGANQPDHARIACGNGIPYITWFQYDGLYLASNIHVKFFNGTAWEYGTENLNVDVYDEARSPVIVNTVHAAHVAWWENDGSARKIYEKYSTVPTVTATPTFTPTPTYTATPTYTSTPSRTPTRTPTSTTTPSASPTLTPTPSASTTPTGTRTPTPTISPTGTITPTRTASPTESPTPTVSSTVTQTPTNPLQDVDLGGKTTIAVPNPATNRVRFLFHPDEPLSVVISIYNVAGERIAKLEAALDSGRGQVVVWNCSRIAAGVYMAFVEVNQKVKQRLKIAVTK